MNLQIETRVGGELKQKSNTGEMVLSIVSQAWIAERSWSLICSVHLEQPELIHFLSRGVTLQTGSLILTGSPLPLARPPQPFMSHGDEVRCWVEGCGKASICCLTLDYELTSRTLRRYSYQLGRGGRRRPDQVEVVTAAIHALALDLSESVEESCYCSDCCHAFLHLPTLLLLARFLPLGRSASPCCLR